MRHARAVALAALPFVFLTTAGRPLPAQRGPVVEVRTPTRGASAESPLVRARGVLDERELRELVRNGFPARLHYRVELWSVGGWFDNLERTVEWDVVVRYDAVERRYHVDLIAGRRATMIGSYAALNDAAAAVGRSYRAPITGPRGDGRYYYNAVLDIEVLSLSDLDEVERWLRGELKPAVRGERNPGTALTRGVRRLLTQLLGGERRRLEGRSGTFQADA